MYHFGGGTAQSVLCHTEFVFFLFPLKKVSPLLFSFGSESERRIKVKVKGNVRKRESESERNAKDKSTGQGMLASGGNISLVIAVPSLSCR